MTNTYVDPATGITYQEVTTDSETLEDGTIVTDSTWIPLESTQLKKKVGRPSKK
jgi:hypothetical protein